MSDAFNKDRLYAENPYFEPFTPERLSCYIEKYGLEQQRKGFWLGFEGARCHPDEMNILNQWERTKVFIEAKGGDV